MIHYVKRSVRPVLAVLLACLLVPPGCTVARDGWLLFGTPSERSEFARTTVMHDIQRAIERAWDVDSLEPPPKGPGPVNRPDIQLVPPLRSLTEELPTCPEAIFRLAPGAEPYRGPRAPNRDLMIAEAQFRVYRSRATSLGLIATDMCVQNTLFAGQCARAFRKDMIGDRAATIDALAAMGSVRRGKAGLCWVLPELRAAETPPRR